MFKKISAFVASLMLTAAAFAAVDVNKGNAAELDSIKGLGPAKSKLILEERKKGEFKSWEDLIARVKGLGDKTAAKLSAEGLTVGGAGYQAPATKTDAKASKPAAAPASTAASAAKN
jgi:competence protein ComEA